MPYFGPVFPFKVQAMTFGLFKKAFFFLESIHPEFNTSGHGIDRFIYFGLKNCQSGAFNSLEGKFRICLKH